MELVDNLISHKSNPQSFKGHSYIHTCMCVYLDGRQQRGVARMSRAIEAIGHFSLIGLKRTAGVARSNTHILHPISYSSLGNQ